MRMLATLLFLTAPSTAPAEQIVAARAIRAQEIIGADDLAVRPGTDGSGVKLEDLVGREARLSLYPGRPVRAEDVGPPTVIDRNQIVPLVYHRGGLRITAEGRSLSRAGAGDTARAMNLSSRVTVSGRVIPSGEILVSE